MELTLLPLPCAPDLSRTDGYKLCPLRSADTPHCWGARCAAFRLITETIGVCVLIERQGAK